MAEATTIVLKVDLWCERCYKKIKKLLCKIPEIRDQVFIEKEDTVKIKVVCCCPERIRLELIRKGGKIIKSIEIVPKKPPARAPAPEPARAPAPLPPPVLGFPPIGMGCKPCYDGHVILVPTYDGPYGNWVSGSCRCNRSYGCRCEYFIEENPTCTIM